MKKSKLLRLTAISMIAVIFISLANCGIPTSTRPVINELDDVDKDEVIIMGRIVVNPPLTPDEQVLSDFEKKVYTNVITFGTYEKEPPAGKDDYDQYGEDEDKDRMFVKLNKTFFLKSKNHSFYIVGGSIVMKVIASGGGHVYIETQAYPTRFKVNIQPTDKAIYIGTLIYKRNEFGDVKKVRLKDEYKKARKEFREKFGGTLKLRKSLLQPIK